MERRQQSQFDLAALDVAADKLTSDADSYGISGVVERSVGIASADGIPNAAEFSVGTPTAQKPSTRKRREVSNVLKRSMADRVDVESLEDKHLTPADVRNEPPSIVGAGKSRFDVSAPKTEEPLDALPSDVGFVEVDNPVCPGSIGSRSDQLPRGACVDAPAVTVDPLSGQLGYLESETNTAVSAYCANSSGIFVQKARVTVVSSQSISTPIASQTVSVVQTEVASLPAEVASLPAEVTSPPGEAASLPSVATSPLPVTTQPTSVLVPRILVAMPPTTAITPPCQATQSSRGVCTPVILSSADGVRVGTTTVLSQSAAAAIGRATNAPCAAVPFGSASATLPRLPPAPSVPSVARRSATPTVPPAPLVSPTALLPSAYSHSLSCGETSQTVYKPVRPGNNGVIAKVNEPGRAIIGVCAPNPTGQGPWTVSVGDLVKPTVGQPQLRACRNKPGELYRQCQFGTYLATHCVIRPQYRV